MQENMPGHSCGNCSCFHHSAISWLVVLFGLNFLFGQLGWFSSETVAWVWPILLVVGGLTKIFGKNRKCC